MQKGRRTSQDNDSKVFTTTLYSRPLYIKDILKE